VGGGPKQNRSLATRLANARNVAVLEVPDPAVHDLEGVRRRGASEIPTFYQRHGEAAQRRVARGSDAEDSAADNQNVELLIRESFEVSDHGQSAVVPSIQLFD
jgi:hypothetical protein